MKIKDGFVLEKVGESYMAVAVNRRTSDFSGLIRLNETGAFLWKTASAGEVTEDELAEALNYAASELAKTDDLQHELIANISHDLRTPLTMISGYSEVMRDIPGEMTPENMQIVIDETHRLTELVNDLLDLSKLQSYPYFLLNILILLHHKGRSNKQNRRQLPRPKRKGCPSTIA